MSWGGGKENKQTKTSPNQPRQFQQNTAQKRSNREEKSLLEMDTLFQNQGENAFPKPTHFWELWSLADRSYTLNGNCELANKFTHFTRQFGKTVE